MLTELAKVMKTSLREDDLLARVGGEEFMLLLPNTGLNDAVAVAENLRQSVAEHIFTLESGEPLRPHRQSGGGFGRRRQPELQPTH